MAARRNAASIALNSASASFFEVSAFKVSSFHVMFHSREVLRTRQALLSLGKDFNTGLITLNQRILNDGSILDQNG
jgi:hypothetical protein